MQDILDGYILTQASICSETVKTTAEAAQAKAKLHLNSSQHLL